ncbi:hypothetical protein TSTA_057360 [Talaromyces stipitatus ATCC 10500]|uniref:Uncharacterized protein n=1 Tax=Talaromyces stipitatus (strain ATCC 10500 / CBS 375.48 / QM 6759 / NRRL 1006) TaxID=441959 RepID=B8MQ98_TALSN|nr:uncharacterized protein TSTA_057360 [Talaromyces stipitatus ATCC 10500]EED13245.1 hypothetical protein TSTA_057360 [Talaromyces stipitatus ATCC 10500]
MRQWIDLCVRTHRLIRANPAFDRMKISGPTLAADPHNTNIWIAGNNTIPNQIEYRLEAGPGTGTSQSAYDLTNAYPSVVAMLRSYGIPERPQIINDYASFQEQIPFGAAFWISQLKRYNTHALRGNWQGGNTLHDLMANLLTKSDPFKYTATGYMPGPKYTVYQNYYKNMTGVRVDNTGGDKPPV